MINNIVRIKLNNDFTLNEKEQDVIIPTGNGTVTIFVEAIIPADTDIRLGFNLPGDNVSRPMIPTQTNVNGSGLNIWRYVVPSILTISAASTETESQMPIKVQAVDFKNPKVNENVGFTEKIGSFATPTDLQNVDQNDLTNGKSYAVVVYENDGITPNGNIWQFSSDTWTDSLLQEEVILRDSVDVDIDLEEYFLSEVDKVTDKTTTDIILDNLSDLNANNLKINSQLNNVDIKRASEGPFDSLNDNVASTDNRTNARIVELIQQTVAGAVLLDTVPTYAELQTRTNFTNGTYLLTDNINTVELIEGNIIGVGADETQNGASTRYQWDGVSYFLNFSTGALPIADNFNAGLMSAGDHVEFELNRDFRQNANTPNNALQLNEEGRIPAELNSINIFNTIRQFGNTSGDLPSNLTAAEAGYSYVAEEDYVSTVAGIEFDINDFAYWTGTKFIRIDTSSDVRSVNGQTGDIIITKASVNLDQVDNIRDINKPVSIFQQAAIDGVQSNLDTVDSLTEKLINKKDTLTAPNSDDYLSTLGIKAELDKKASKLNNNSITCKVTNFGVDDFTIDDIDSYSYTAGVIKVVRNQQGDEEVPLTVPRYIKAGSDTNTLVGSRLGSFAYFYEDFGDLISQADIDDGGANLITDLTLEDAKFEEFGLYSDPRFITPTIIGQPKLKIGYDFEIKEDEIGSRCWFAAFSHLTNNIDIVKPYGITTNQAMLSIAQYKEGLDIYSKSGNDIVKGSNDFSLSRNSGSIFINGVNFGGTGNQNLSLTDTITDAKIVKVYPGVGGADNIIDDNLGVGYTEITPDEYYNTTTESLSTTGIGGSETLVSILGYSIINPDILIQIMPQAAGTSAGSSTTDNLYADLEEANNAVRDGSNSYENIDILNNQLFIPVSFLVIEDGATDLNDASNVNFIDVKSIGGTSSFENSTGDVSAVNVLNVGVAGFTNQESLNIDVDTKLSNLAANDVTLQNNIDTTNTRIDTTETDISNISTRINIDRDNTYTFTADGTTTTYNFIVGYTNTDRIDVTVGGLEFVETEEYELIDNLDGSITLDFTNGEIPRLNYTIKVRQTKRI